MPKRRKYQQWGNDSDVWSDKDLRWKQESYLTVDVDPDKVEGLVV